jgi:hypothetical protein
MLQTKYRESTVILLDKNVENVSFVARAQRMNMPFDPKLGSTSEDFH